MEVEYNAEIMYYSPYDTTIIYPSKLMKLIWNSLVTTQDPMLVQWVNSFDDDDQSIEEKLINRLGPKKTHWVDENNQGILNPKMRIKVHMRLARTYTLEKMSNFVPPKCPHVAYLLQSDHMEFAIRVLLFKRHHARYVGVFDESDEKEELSRLTKYQQEKPLEFFLLNSGATWDSIGGQHWTCAIVDHRRKSIEHFNSFGPNAARWLNVYRILQQKFPSYKTFAFPIRLQSGGTECGMYVLWYIYNRIQGRPMNTIASIPVDDDMMKRSRLMFFQLPVHELALLSEDDEL